MPKIPQNCKSNKAPQGQNNIAKFFTLKSSTNPSVQNHTNEYGNVVNYNSQLDDSYLPTDDSRHREEHSQWENGPNLMGKQVQSLQTLQRSVEASTQMLYDVFDYTIGMLEELEKHETENRANSGILSHLIPVLYRKPIKEVCTGIEVELQCLSIQMRYQSREVVDKSRKMLVCQTLLWAASRDGLPLGPVDHYCRNVMEVLLSGIHYDLPERERREMRATEKDVNDAMYQLARGRHVGAEQDKEFHNNPSKKAKVKEKRDEGPQEQPRQQLLHTGAQRLFTDDVKNKMPELWRALENYLPETIEDMPMKERQSANTGAQRLFPDDVKKKMPQRENYLPEPIEDKPMDLR